MIDAARDALAVYRLVAVLLTILQDRSMFWLYDEVERPLISVLSRMEDVGIGVDVPELTRMRDHLVDEVSRLEGAIQQLAGPVSYTHLKLPTKRIV